MINFQNKIIYQIYPSSFMDGNNDGYGDFRGIVSKLSYLANLGIDFIWICPFYCSPKFDNGYDVSDYCQIDPQYGTMEDFQLLVQTAKKFKLEIMIDLVFNHTSSQHPWFLKALKGSLEHQKYYFFMANIDNLPPTNWTSFFGGSAWEYVPELNQWYLHLYSKHQPDLNWANPQVRQQLMKIVNFWIAQGVKGIRFDVLSLISKPPFIDAPKEQLPTERSYFADGSQVHEYIQEMHDKTYGKYDDIVTIGEMSGSSLEKCKVYSILERQELSMTFNFHHLNVDSIKGDKWALTLWNKKLFKQTIQDWQLGLQATNSWTGLFTSNHDTPRINQRFGDVEHFWFASSTLFPALNFVLRGTPCLYQGEEIGMVNCAYEKTEDFKAIETLNAYSELKRRSLSKKEIINIFNLRSRDAARTPMQWNDIKNAGFSLVQPWMQVNSNYLKINAASQVKNRNSVYHFFQKLIQLRKQEFLLREGQIAFIDTSDDVFCFYRFHASQSQKIYVMMNLSSQTILTDFYLIQQAQLLLSNYQNSDHLVLKPFELKIIKGI